LLRSVNRWPRPPVLLCPAKPCVETRLPCLRLTHLSSPPAVTATPRFPAHLPIKGRLAASIAVFRVGMGVRCSPVIQLGVVACLPLRVPKNGVSGIDHPELFCGFNLRFRCRRKQVGVKLLHQTSVSTFDLLGLCRLGDPESFIMRVHSCETEPLSPFVPLSTASRRVACDLTLA
jgi:hypothetical protein